MPFVNVKLIEGVFTPGQKQQIIRDLTAGLLTLSTGDAVSRVW